MGLVPKIETYRDVRILSANVENLALGHDVAQLRIVGLRIASQESDLC